MWLDTMSNEVTENLATKLSLVGHHPISWRRRLFGAKMSKVLIRLLRNPSVRQRCSIVTPATGDGSGLLDLTNGIEDMERKTDELASPVKWTLWMTCIEDSVRYSW